MTHSRKILLLLFAAILAFTAIAQQSRRNWKRNAKSCSKDIEQTSGLLKQTKRTRLDVLPLRDLAAANPQAGATRQDAPRGNELPARQYRAHSDRGGGPQRRHRAAEGGIRQDCRDAYRQKLMHSDLLFLLSAKSFNDAFLVWQYLRQYERYRQRQAKLIMETQQTLVDKIKSLEDRKVDKEKLLTTEQRQSRMLGMEMQAKNQLLEELKGDEARLARDLESKQASANKLNKAIEKVIRDEMERIRREERAAASVAKNNSETASAGKGNEALRHTGNRKRFQRVPGQLGPIALACEERRHHRALRAAAPSNDSEHRRGTGIDIQTDKGAQVRSVF